MKRIKCVLEQLVIEWKPGKKGLIILYDGNEVMLSIPNCDFPGVHDLRIKFHNGLKLKTKGRKPKSVVASLQTEDGMLRKIKLI